MELDYQMALLLQHRFEQDHQSTRNEHESDRELARLLQEQFEQEANVENPTNLVYDKPKSGLNSSKSLTDPSWELVDPTPDIHSLFIAFNQRYFYNKLLAVCVSWSKRMTSCAGVCSYQGRGGMCSITLSEPLLKLRPRKDLIETLLHEMIHAYLFVTHNNRDRDGHGPEFHKHMYRINKESGTNITVYHNFHDEVDLYRQHWWRCDGPCQRNKPFFGMVRRATNRAPGPNDRWWAAHSTTCGGTFIKVKEPEKKTKPETKSTVKGVKDLTKTNTGDNTKNGDIRNFIPSTSGAASNVKSFKDLTKTKTTNTGDSTKNGDIRDFIPSTSGAANNIKGFKDLTNKVKGKYNSTSTIVVTKTKTTTTTDSTFKPHIINNDPDRGKSKKGQGDRCTDDFLKVRNHWQDKFNNTKRRTSSVEQTISPKIPKFSEGECPICNRKFPMTELNDHLDNCLNQEPDTVDLTSQTDEPKDCNAQDKDKVPCLACGKKIFRDDLNSHLEDCMSDIFKVEVDSGDDKAEQEYNCPFCLKLVSEGDMKDHIDGCLSAANDSLTHCFLDDDF